MRPYPNRDLALRHLRHTQAVYRYGRFPQRYILGMPPLDGPELQAASTSLMVDRLAGDLRSSLSRSWQGRLVLAVSRCYEDFR